MQFYQRIFLMRIYHYISVTMKVAASVVIIMIFCPSYDTLQSQCTYTVVVFQFSTLPPAFTCSKLTIEILQQCVKYVER